MDFGRIRIRQSPRSIMTGVTALFLATSYRMLPAIISDYVHVDRMSEIQSRSYNGLPEQYDFIVVGGGSSGSLVGNRLSKHFKTLILEAGGTPFPLQNVPAKAPLMVGHRDLDWRFFTTPQKHSCLSLKNRTSFWPRGRGLGGTSNLNTLVWIRGHHLDYDNWAEMTGDKRWSYDQLLPYFKVTENYLGPGNETYHGYNGEMTVGPVSYKPLVKYFLGAATELGYPIKDLNAPFDEAFNEHSFNHVMGHRQSSYNAFLRPIENERRDRLTIRKYAYVTKVLIDDHSRAYGVEYEQGGRLFRAMARMEVVLSAGAINSPKILMLSGIGPSLHLEELGIKPIVNLPGVGKNLQDHVSALVGPFAITRRDRGRHLTFLPSRDSRPSTVIDYLTRGQGPLAQSGSMASGFIMTNKSDLHNGHPWPDTQLLLIGLPQDDEGLVTLSKMFNLDLNIAKQFYGPLVNRDSFSIMTSVTRPKSRGQILLSSKNPKAPPLIDPNYYSHADDIKTVLKGISKALELVENSHAFRTIGAKLLDNPFPSCRKLPFRSEAYWECYAREYTLTVYHPSGGCKMGNEEDKNAVVDSSLRVKGVKNLRVLDASIMPQIVSSNINPACTVIAERGASMILEDYPQAVQYVVTSIL